jgi:hypothetical protein
MLEERFENHIPEAFPLVIGMHSHVGNMKIPATISNYPSHSNRLRIALGGFESDVTAKPAASGNRSRLGWCFRRESGHRAKIKIVGGRRVAGLEFVAFGEADILRIHG